MNLRIGTDNSNSKYQYEYSDEEDGLKSREKKKKLIRMEDWV